MGLEQRRELPPVREPLQAFGNIAVHVGIPVEDPPPPGAPCLQNHPAQGSRSAPGRLGKIEKTGDASRSEHPVDLGEGFAEIARIAQSVAPRNDINRPRRQTGPAHVSVPEPDAGGGRAAGPGPVDHRRGEVEPGDLAIGVFHSEPETEVAGAAGQVQADGSGHRRQRVHQALFPHPVAIQGKHPGDGVVAVCHQAEQLKVQFPFQPGITQAFLQVEGVGWLHGWPWAVAGAESNYHAWFIARLLWDIDSLFKALV